MAEFISVTFLMLAAIALLWMLRRWSEPDIQLSLAVICLLVSMVAHLIYSTWVERDQSVRLSALSQYERNWPDARHLAAVADGTSTNRRTLFSVAYQETRWNVDPSVRGKRGEIGRFQIKPETAREHCLGLDVTKYKDNVLCAAILLRGVAERTDPRAAITAFNGQGPRAIAYTRSVLEQIGELEVRP